MSATPESKVKAEIIFNLKKRGAYYFMPVQTGYGQRTVDILACIGGRFVAIECKAGVNKPTATQQKTLSDIAGAGGVAVVAYSWADVEKAL